MINRCKNSILYVLIAVLLAMSISFVNTRCDEAANYVMCDLECVKVSD